MSDFSLLLVSGNPASYDGPPTTVGLSHGLPIRQTFSSPQAITPSDTKTYSPPLLSLFIGTGGTLVVTSIAGATLTFLNVASGTLLPIACTQVQATNTTCSGIIGLN
jgi:hypothetical protein